MADKADVLEALKHSNVFLTGGAGVGKSYITNEVISDYRKRGKQVVSLGSTGVSAVNVGGFTIHSFFVFGISSNFEELAQNDKRNHPKQSFHFSSLLCSQLGYCSL
jgi:nucleoside-triphosphatase THEP1